MEYNPKLTGERMNKVNEASPASETSDVERLVMRFTPEYEAQLCAAINQKYIDQIGTESYERSTLLAVIKSLRDLLNKASKPEKEEIN